MKVRTIFAMLIGIGLQVSEAKGWPGFRGDGSSRVASSEGLPLNWTSEEGVAWRVDLAGYGQSSPVVWNDVVYVTSTGGKNKEDLFVEAFDLSGMKKWTKKIEATEKVEEVTKMISQGAPTPVVGPDGVYVFFESGDLAALSHGGKVLWHRKLTKEFGVFKGGHGVGSSLVGLPDRLALLIDHDGPSYLLCVDRKSGKTVWKADRESRVSWTTPLYLEHKREGQIVISSNGLLDAYGAEDGKRLWWTDGLQKNTVASPSYSNGVVVIGSSFPKQSIAVRLGGKGDVKKSHIKWKPESVTSSFASPLLHRETAYFVNRAGSLQAQRMKDGTQRWEFPLSASCWASPVAAGDRLYFFCKDGKAVVLDGTKEDAPEVLGKGDLSLEEGTTLYGVAFSKGKIVVRTGRELICLSQKDDGN